MIPITIQQAQAYCIRKLQDEIEWIAGEYTLEIDDVDELHDYTIESIEIDNLYYALYSLLPQVLDECINYIEDEQDYWDGNAEYKRNVFGY